METKIELIICQITINETSSETDSFHCPAFSLAQ
jgi:hypothetical protein